MDEVFAKPIEPASESEVSTIEPVNREEVHEESKTAPEAAEGLMTAEFFGIRNDFFLKLDPIKSEQLKGIDEFVLKNMADEGLSINQENFKSFINRVMELMEIDSESNPQEKMDKLFKQIQLSKFLR